ncbi:MAG: hypothetical protein HND48_15490 [Chloroflexi bacterium]|nr:hypothetical protein [Chloroflexota bacterium]
MTNTVSPKPRGSLLSLSSQPVLSGALIFAVSAVILSVLIFASNGFNGVDGYYHARLGFDPRPAQAGA